MLSSCEAVGSFDTVSSCEKAGSCVASSSKCHSSSSSKLLSLGRTSYCLSTATSRGNARSEARVKITQKKDPATWAPQVRDALQGRGAAIEKDYEKYGDHYGHLVVSDYTGTEGPLLPEYSDDTFVNPGHKSWHPIIKDALKGPRLQLATVRTRRSAVGNPPAYDYIDKYDLPDYASACEFAQKCQKF